MRSIIQKHSVLLERLRQAKAGSILIGRTNVEPIVFAPNGVIEICREIDLFYEKWEPPQSSEDDKEIQIYAPGLTQLAGSLYTGDSGKTLADWKREILHLSLFVDKLWIPDPAEYIAKGLCAGYANIDTSSPRVNDVVTRTFQGPVGYSSEFRQVLRDNGIGLTLANHDSILRVLFEKKNTLQFKIENAIDFLQVIQDLAPLFESGVLDLYPPQKVYKTKVAEQLFGRVRSFKDEELENAWPDLFVAEGLLFSKSLNSSYASIYSAEFTAINSTLSRISDEFKKNSELKILNSIDTKLIAALPRLKLPYFEEMDANSLAQVRLNDENFDKFREKLRALTDRIKGEAGNPRFTQDVLQAEKELDNEVQELLNKVDFVTSLRKNLANNGIDFGVGVFVGMALMASQPLGAAIEAAALSALGKALLVTLVEQRDPVARVAYQLSSGRIPRANKSKQEFSSWKSFSGDV